MNKFLFKSFLTIFIILISAIIFFTYVGYETNKFDDLIKNKANKTNKYIKLDFNKIKIYLDLKEFDLVIKLLKPNILIKDEKINVNKIDLYLSLKSFYNPDFSLKKASIGFKRNDIKDLTKITNIFIPKIINKKLKKFFSKGTIEGEFLIPFNLNGNISKDYQFSGRLLEASIHLPNDFIIQNLNSEINYGGEDGKQEFEVLIKKGSLLGMDLQKSIIKLKKEKNLTKIKSSVYINGKVNLEKVKKIASILNLDISEIKGIDGTIKVKTNVNLDISKNFKIKNLSYLADGTLKDLEIFISEKKLIKKYFPDYSDKLFFKETTIKFSKSKPNQIFELDGLIKLKDKYDSFKIISKYDYGKKIYNIKGNLNLTNKNINILKVNYKKKVKKKSELFFNFNFAKNKYFKINNLKFLENKTKINLSNIKFNKKFEIDDFEKIEINTFLDEINNNNLFAEKSNNIKIIGEAYDAEPLLKSLLKESNNRNFSKKFNSDVKINFDKAFTGTGDDITNFSMIGSIKNGDFIKLILKGNYSNEEIIEMSIYHEEIDKKTVHIVSDRARPFVKHFNFIKGFEGGKLEYESVISKKKSNSSLSIVDFKVSEVPSLAKLLTLASLQGIADTLSGEGIRFDSFDLTTNSVDDVLNIEDALAMGPAVSILFDGYVDKGKMLSLRGTLVPATKLNAFIAKIPLLGNILVGKKTGEGVVGVSFKMKGQPNNIKTTVNPIKTLTPRFIVRAVEKIKKQKKEAR